MFRVLYPHEPLANFLFTWRNLPREKDGRLLMATCFLGKWYGVSVRHGDLALMLSSKRLPCVPEMTECKSDLTFLPMRDVSEAIGRPVRWFYRTAYFYPHILANTALVLDAGVSAVDGFCRDIEDFLGAAVYAPRRCPVEGHIRFSKVFSPEAPSQLVDVVGQSLLCPAIRLLVFPFPELVPGALFLELCAKLMRSTGRSVVVLEPLGEYEGLDLLRSAWHQSMSCDMEVLASQME